MDSQPSTGLHESDATSPPPLHSLGPRVSMSTLFFTFGHLFQKSLLSKMILRSVKKVGAAKHLSALAKGSSRKAMLKVQ